MKVRPDTKIAFLLTAALGRGFFYCLERSEAETNQLFPDKQAKDFMISMGLWPPWNSWDYLSVAVFVLACCGAIFTITMFLSDWRDSERKEDPG